MRFFLTKVVYAMMKILRSPRLICITFTIVYVCVLTMNIINTRKLTNEIEPAQESQQPHILFILADDFGWNDIGILYFQSYIYGGILQQMI